ncbi:MAG: ABC transporter ATP-binding protein [Armatimonadetes bacterium]|nr:ABC transporter ATP-binding protein [Armatimonadota bacterium]
MLESRGSPGERAGADLLEIDDLAIRFGGISALDGVSLRVAEGTVTSVIGPNGAGKTTLYNCICGLYRPHRGRVRLAGEDLLGLRPDAIARRAVARTFQTIELFRGMTALDNLLLGRHLRFRATFWDAALATRRWWAEEARHREVAERILDFLDLQAVRNRRVGDLPVGQQKLVELGRALALEPRLLLLDEPSAGMTVEEKEDLVFRIGDVRDEFGATVVLVEHDLRVVMGISDRVVVLDHGVVIAAGPPEAVQRDPEVIRAYLGEAGA